MSVARLLEALLLSSLCVAFLLLALTETRRTGYAPDEEVTFFAVEGIRRYGISSMPSGVISARGPAYTAACAVAGALLGFDLPGCRGVSLAAALLGLVSDFVTLGQKCKRDPSATTPRSATST